MTEMNELIARQLMAETSPVEDARLAEWRGASAENEATYVRCRRVWALLGKTGRGRPGRAPSAEQLVRRGVVRRLPISPDAGRERRWRESRGRSRVRLGAAVVLAATAAAASVVILISRPGPNVSFGVAEFSTDPHNETSTVGLNDGTVVRLAPGSRLEVDDGSPGMRRVRFEGIGYFAVARDETRPFIVLTEAGNAEVLGTRFELRIEDKKMRVVVVEGRVALQAVGIRKELGANQLGRVSLSQPPTVVDVEDVTEFLAWVDGLFVFQSTPLSQVARELGAHYGVEIEIEDRELADREVTAWLREQSFEAALTAVCGAVGAACTIHRDSAVMRVPVR